MGTRLSRCGGPRACPRQGATVGRNRRPARAIVVALLGLALSGGAARATDAAAPAPERVGVYDSRAIAYAHFWTDAHQAGLRQRMADAGAAKAAGDAEHHERLNRQLKQEQDRLHLQVFSTAAIDDVLRAIPERVRAVEREAGVTRLVSKWDRDTLRTLDAAEKVDVTALLLREFVLPDARARVLQGLLKQEPLPLARAKELLARGEL